MAEGEEPRTIEMVDPDERVMIAGIISMGQRYASEIMIPRLDLIGLDVNTPLPIPILASPVKDRASLGDPTLEASLAAALKRLTPARDRPVPFTPLNLPDPFEHLRYGQLRNPPAESATPPVIPLQRPK